MARKLRPWTNKSVVRFAGTGDPVKKISSVARSVVIAAIDDGWTGPPFDPLELAEILDIKTVANDEVRDARIVPSGRRFSIEYNPNRTPARVRYSIAHEIAHTLFSDCAELVRYRDTIDRGTTDDWQLEALCNIAAAEILMPVGSLPEIVVSALTAKQLVNLRDRYAVSTEAMAIRLVQVTDEPCAMICASTVDTESTQSVYRIDYAIASNTWKHSIVYGTVLPADSAIANCKGVGHTWMGAERWWKGGPRLHVEAVGIPPYPGTRYPRVIAIVTTPQRTSSQPGISYVTGDATRPSGAQKKLIVHVVNDGTANWGGRGFARALAKACPDIQDDFREWSKEHSLRKKFGQVRFARIDSETAVASMICQKGYGTSPTPRIRYGALKNCLKIVSEYAHKNEYSVHMPRIGTGEAGGNWSIVAELVSSTIVDAGVRVTVYDLPGIRPQRRAGEQLQLTVS